MQQSGFEPIIKSVVHKLELKNFQYIDIELVTAIKLQCGLAYLKCTFRKNQEVKIS